MKIKEGEKLPIGYGYAWDNWSSLTTQIYFIPLNFILRGLRKFWFKLAKREKTEYQKAFQAGFKEGKNLNKERMRSLEIEIEKAAELIRYIRKFRQ